MTSAAAKEVDGYIVYIDHLPATIENMKVRFASSEAPKQFRDAVQNGDIEILDIFSFGRMRSAAYRIRNAETIPVTLQNIGYPYEIYERENVFDIHQSGPRLIRLDQNEYFLQWKSCKDPIRFCVEGLFIQFEYSNEMVKVESEIYSPVLSQPTSSIPMNRTIAWIRPTLIFTCGATKTEYLFADSIGTFVPPDRGTDETYSQTVSFTLLTPLRRKMAFQCKDKIQKIQFFAERRAAPYRLKGKISIALNVGPQGELFIDEIKP